MKIDPGSKTTGLAVVNDATGRVVWAAELAHRGQQKVCFDPQLMANRLNGFDVYPKYLTMLHRGDGYDYTRRERTAIPPRNEFRGSLAGVL